MKKPSCILLLVLMATGVSLAQNPFGNALAISEHIHHWMYDEWGDSMEVFDSSSINYMDASANVPHSPNAFTLEAWFAKPSYDEKDLQTMVVANGYELHVTAWEQLYAWENGGPPCLGQSQLMRAAWYHVAYVHDGEARYMYLNGSLDRTGPAFDVSEDLDHALRIGADHWAEGYSPAGRQFQKGYIDELRIWNVARTQAQIKAAMNDTLGPEYYGNSDKGLVAYYRFDALENLGMGTDGLADDVRDLSVNQLHGDIIGSPNLVAHGTIPDTTSPVMVLPFKHGTPLLHLTPGTSGGTHHHPLGLQFHLDKRSEPTVKLYNMLGRCIRTIKLGSLGSGTHTVQWDGNNDKGIPLPAAVYFWVLEVQGASTNANRAFLLR